MRNLVILTLPTILLLIACERTEDISFEEWDKDEDNKIDRIEFRETFTRHYFSDWNDKDNDYLDDEDLYQGIFGKIDQNNDKYLTEAEWLESVEYWYAEYAVIEFDSTDADADGRVGMAEFTDNDNLVDFYENWDTNKEDELLTEDELAAGLFSLWDVDKSGYIEETEYQNLKGQYLGIDE